MQTFDDFYLAKKLSNDEHNLLFYSDPVIHDTNISFKEFIKKQRERIHFLKQLNSTHILGLEKQELIYQYTIFPIKLFVKGFFRNKDISAFLIPLLVIIRIFLYLI